MLRLRLDVRGSSIPPSPHNRTCHRTFRVECGRPAKLLFRRPDTPVAHGVTVMSTSQRTFEQVRSILGKLDRDIDAARARRLQTRHSPMPMAATPMAAVVPAPAVMAAPPAGPAIPDPGRSGYGKARPSRPQNFTPASSPYPQP